MKTDPVLTLSYAISEYHKVAESRGCSDRHKATLRYHLSNFEKFYSGAHPLHRIKVDGVNAFLGKLASTKTRLNFRCTLVALGNFAKKRGWLAYGMPTAFESSDKPIVKNLEHPIDDPEVLSRLLYEAEISAPNMVRWLVIGAFAGVRAAERGRLTEDNIFIDSGCIILGTNVTKTARRRVVNMTDNLREWLEKYKDQPLVPHADPSRIYKDLKVLEKRAGVKLAKNGLRASAASYLLLVTENAASTAMQLGHSVQELESVYYQPSLKEKALQWFAIKPLDKQ